MRPILGASAVPALLLRDHGHERVLELFDLALLSTVNLAEVVAKLFGLQMPFEAFEQEVAASGVKVMRFEPTDAYTPGALRRDTRNLGLSFGDCACFVLAKRLARPVVAAERAWAKLDLGIAVEAIR